MGDHYSVRGTVRCPAKLGARKSRATPAARARGGRNQRRVRRAAGLLSLLLWSFGCGDQLVEYPFHDLPPPTIISTFPLPDATSVAAESTISATFSQPMRATSLDALSFTVTQGSTPVAGVVSLDGENQVATFDPVAVLTAGRRYTATVTTAAKNSRGTALAADYSWSFTLGNFNVVELSASAQLVAAPDYELDTTALLLLTEAHGIVQSVSGSAELRERSVSGQAWVVLNASGLDTYAELDAAFTSASAMPIALRIPAAAFALVDEDLSVPQTRTLIVANIVAGVPSYQAFEITFHATL